jgi:hypothetical protein
MCVATVQQWGMVWAPTNETVFISRLFNVAVNAEKRFEEDSQNVPMLLDISREECKNILKKLIFYKLEPINMDVL